MSLTPTTSRSYRLGVRILREKCLCYNQRRFSSTSSTAVVDRDVVIVGGGPAGLALASALGSSPSIRQNCTITLIEGGDLDKIKAWLPAPGSFSNRVSSLTNKSQRFLKDIGVWNYVEVNRTCPMEDIQVWDGISDARASFSAADLGLPGPEPSMARLTENLNLQRGILRHLETISQVQLVQKTKVSSITPDTENEGAWPLVHLDNNTVLRARLLIGADGFNSPVKKYAQIPSYGWAYNTQAIVATMSHPPRGAFEGPNTTCYQRFLPTGPIAFLPLSPVVSSLVWSTKPLIAKALLACDPQVLVSMINSAFRLPSLSMKYLQDRILEADAAGTPMTPSQIHEEILWREGSHGIDQTSAYSSVTRGKVASGIPPADSEEVPPLVTDLQSGTIASFPLRFNHAESYIGEGSGARTVLVGDAAHTIHPLAGQGLNLGLADAECLARCIETSLLSGGDIGSHTSLLPYGQERYLANHALMSLVDKLHKIYSIENRSAVWARSVGVEVLNELDSLKAAIMLMAGAQSNRTLASSGWEMTSSAVEGIAATAKTFATIQSVLGNVVGSALQSFASPGKVDKI